MVGAACIHSTPQWPSTRCETTGFRVYQQLGVFWTLNNNHHILNYNFSTSVLASWGFFARAIISCLTRSILAFIFFYLFVDVFSPLRQNYSTTIFSGLLLAKYGLEFWGIIGSKLNSGGSLRRGGVKECREGNTVSPVPAEIKWGVGLGLEL